MLDTIRHVRCEGLYAQSSKAQDTCNMPAASTVSILNVAEPSSPTFVLTAPLHDPA
jgi:hypothetical protein